MIKTKHFLVTNETYKKYINKYNTDRVDRFLKIYTFERFNKTIESFDKRYNDIKYDVTSVTFDKKFSNYKNTDGYELRFLTNSNTKYRIDLIPIKNFNINIFSDFVWYISFTLDKYDITDDKYEELTGLNEEKEVLMRIGEILEDFNISKNFVIGNTSLQKKINLYSNFVYLVFPNYNIQMDYCEVFLDNKGLYIWK